MKHELYEIRVDCMKLGLVKSSGYVVSQFIKQLRQRKLIGSLLLEKKYPHPLQLPTQEF